MPRQLPFVVRMLCAHFFAAAGALAHYAPEGDLPFRDARLAYRHKFFRCDEHGRPMPETLVEFLVPSHLLINGFPSRDALRLVSKRMGWV